MKYIFSLLAICFLILIQTSFLWIWFHFSFNLILIGVILLFWFGEKYLSLFWASVGGIFLDLVSGAVWGVFAISLIACWLILVILDKIFTFDKILALALVLLLAPFFQNLIFWLIFYFANHPLNFGAIVLISCWEGVISMVLGLVLAWYYTRKIKEKSEFVFER